MSDTLPRAPPRTIPASWNGALGGAAHAFGFASRGLVSDTTGAPKAVMQTHSAYALTSEAFPAWLGLDATDRMLAMLPLSHINAQAYSTIGALGCGAELLLMQKFSASPFLTDARRLGATQFNAVGEIIQILLRSEVRSDDADSPLRLAYAALALPEPQHRAFEERFGLPMRRPKALGFQDDLQSAA
jgi:crotonobetaine/carnitine-CoA ligase